MTTTAPVEVACQFFARCDHAAAGVTEHPILTAVPTCQRCADRFGLQLAAFDMTLPDGSTITIGPEGGNRMSVVELTTPAGDVVKAATS